jgi:hypothetical protein
MQLVEMGAQEVAVVEQIVVLADLLHQVKVIAVEHQVVAVDILQQVAVAVLEQSVVLVLLVVVELLEMVEMG